jgi:hypothetical protein
MHFKLILTGFNFKSLTVNSNYTAMEVSLKAVIVSLQATIVPLLATLKICEAGKTARQFLSVKQD